MLKYRSTLEGTARHLPCQASHPTITQAPDYTIEFKAVSASCVFTPMSKEVVSGHQNNLPGSAKLTSCAQKPSARHAKPSKQGSCYSLARQRLDLRSVTLSPSCGICPCKEGFRRWPCSLLRYCPHRRNRKNRRNSWLFSWRRITPTLTRRPLLSLQLKTPSTKLPLSLPLAFFI